MGLLEKMFGSYSQGQIKKIMGKVSAVEALADKYKGMSDDDMRRTSDILKARLAEGDGPEAMLDGQLHLFGAEVAFGTDEHEGILARREGLHQRFLVALVAVSDKFLSCKGLCDKLIEGSHAIQCGEGGLERLLHG